MVKFAKVDWLKIEEAMRRSIRGASQSTDSYLFEPAYREDPKRYSDLHSKVRAEEQDKVRNGF